jgi:hypothetical protein
MKEMSDLHDPAVIAAERELAETVGLAHAVAAAQQQLVSWQELPDGSLEAMADRSTFERAALAHRLAASALLGDAIEDDLTAIGPLSQAQACLEALERASQCVFLDDTGRTSLFAERLVAVLAVDAPTVVPAVVVPAAGVSATDESGLPGAVISPGEMATEERFVLRLLAAKLTTAIDPDDGATLQAWMGDIAQMMDAERPAAFTAPAVRLFAAVRAIYGLHLGEGIATVAADLASTADQLPALRRRDANGEWVQD